MALEERETFQHGPVVFPLASAIDNSSLQDADPVIFYLLEFLKHAITKYAGARILAEATRAGVTRVTKVVASTAPWDPSDYLSTTQFQFPLLAAHRLKTRFREKTVVKRNDESSIEVAYIFPPLDAGQASAMTPLLRAVAAVIDNRIELGFDPTFTPSGGVAGDRVWSSDFAGVESITVVGATWVKYAGMGEMVFPAVVLDVAVKELATDGPETAWPLLSGATVDVQLQPGTAPEEGSLIDEVAVHLVDYTLSILSIAPATGSVVGGTSVTLTGTGFKKPMRVLIGGLPATNVVAVSATSITCVTPVFAGYPSPADVTVINENQQSATLEDGFTYAA